MINLCYMCFLLDGLCITQWFTTSKKALDAEAQRISTVEESKSSGTIEPFATIRFDTK